MLFVHELCGIHILERAAYAQDAHHDDSRQRVGDALIADVGAQVHEQGERTGKGGRNLMMKVANSLDMDRDKSIVNSYWERSR